MIKWKLYNYDKLSNDYIITMLQNGFYYELDDNFNTKWVIMVNIDNEDISEYYIDTNRFDDIIRDIKNNIYENTLTKNDIF